MVVSRQIGICLDNIKLSSGQDPGLKDHCSLFPRNPAVTIVQVRRDSRIYNVVKGDRITLVVCSFFCRYSGDFAYSGRINIRSIIAIFIILRNFFIRPGNVHAILISLVFTSFVFKLFGFR